MSKLVTLKHLNSYLINTLSRNNLSNNTNKKLLPVVNTALNNYSNNNNKDWILETFKNESFYLDTHLSLSNNIQSSINRLIVNKNQYYELALLNWYPKQISAIHNHHKGGCFLLPLNGSLLETQFDIINNNMRKYNFNTNQLFTISPNDVIKKREHILPIQSVNYIDDTIGVHQVQNNTTKNVISLHLYLY